MQNLFKFSTSWDLKTKTKTKTKNKFTVEIWSQIFARVARCGFEISRIFWKSS